MNCTLLVVWSLALGAAALPATAQRIGDERALAFHLDQRSLEAGRVAPEDIVAYGRYLFNARFTALDGAGRPGSTGSGLPTRRPTLNARSMLRTSGPDANSCASCHNEPVSGGAGSFVANVFVGAQEREPVLESVSGSFSAERKTPSMFGSGLIELAAREMTGDLHAIRAQAIRRAAAEGKTVELPLLTKGVSFGHIAAGPNGTVVTERVEGVDKDLVVRPWSQKGVVTSLRTFTVTAMNHHHGMQANERYGIRRTGSRDFDRDGVEDELTEGDVTAVAAYQATLEAPLVVRPSSPERARAADRGRELMSGAGCSNCHLPAIALRSTRFAEPGPYNLEGTLRQQEVGAPIQIDLGEFSWAKRLRRDDKGQVLVEAFTDLKRHRIADPETPQLANEVVTQGFAPTDEFVTKRLWEVGSSLGSYGHRGDITTIHEVIMAHGGEARGSRLKYAALHEADRRAIIEFLKTLQTPLDAVAQQPPNVLVDDLVARLGPAWSAETTAATSQGVEGAQQIVSRAVAAADRAERTRDRIKSLASRIAYERAKVTAPQAAVATRVLTQLPDRIVASIEKEIGASVVASDPHFGAMQRSLARAEGALVAAHSLADESLRIASIASGDGIAVTPLGYVPPQAILANLQRFRSSDDGTAIYKELTAWCEDLAFRIEQIGQQVAAASLRMEAYAASHSGPAATATAQAAKVSLK